MATPLMSLGAEPNEPVSFTHKMSSTELVLDAFEGLSRIGVVGVENAAAT
jgi:hypothetical protein